MFNHNDNNTIFAFILYGCVIIYTYPIFMSTLTQHFIGAICLFRYLYIHRALRNRQYFMAAAPKAVIKYNNNNEMQM